MFELIGFVVLLYIAARAHVRISNLTARFEEAMKGAKQ